MSVGSPSEFPKPDVGIKAGMLVEIERQPAAALVVPLIEDFTLSIQRGQQVALVGRPGSGKSTVARSPFGLPTP